MPNPSKTKANLGAAWMTDNDIRAALAKIHHNRNQHDNMVRKAHSDLTRRRSSSRAHSTGSTSVTATRW